MREITLTRRGPGTPIYINPEMIEGFFDVAGEGSRVSLNGEDICVQETSSQIVSLLRQHSYAQITESRLG
jgi:hypothetical protein